MTISLDRWLAEVKAAQDADRNGIYLIHCGVVRGTAKADGTTSVTGMHFSCDRGRLAAAEARALAAEGVHAVKIAMADDGFLKVGDDMMRVLVGADTRLHAFAALESLLTEIKTTCVREEETK